jgi:hypothetical protein
MEGETVKKALLDPIRHWLIGSAVLAILASGSAFAQTQVTGTITGPAGVNLAGTIVTATDANNKVFRGTVDASGKFTFPLEPGTYTITVSSPGQAQQVFQNVAVTEGQSVTQDVTLAQAKPFCIVKAAAPIPLTEGIDSDAFKSAPEILLNSGANITEGFDQVANFRGASTVGGRAKVMYSDQGLHIAADLTFAKPNTNFGSDAELWKGNSLEILFQNDPFVADRTALDPMHNFRLVVGLGEQPRVRIGNTLDQNPSLDGTAAVPIAELVAVSNRSDNAGNMVRVNIPWGVFRTGGDAPAAITPPKDNDMAAMNIIINNSTAEATAEAPARQFSLSWSGLPGSTTNPTGLVPVQFCPTPPQ